MRKFLLFTAVLYLVGSISYGQDVVPSVTTGSKAVLFSFSGLSFLNAGTFNGGIGGKYFLSDNMAVRAGLQFASASSKTPANPPTGQSGIDGSQSATTIGVSGEVEYHLAKGRVTPFIGGGVGFSTTSTESKNVVTGTPPLTQTTTKNRGAGETIGGVGYTGGTTLAVYALVGVEFFLYKEISLGAEYQVGFASTSQKDQEVTTGPTTTTTKMGSTSVIGINTAGFLTLAVYF